MSENKYKYIIRLSFLFVFISILTSVFIYRYFIIEKMIGTVGIFNYHIANNYINKIWDKEVVDINGINEIKTNEQLIKLTQNTLSYFNGLGCLVNIYDINNNKLISNYSNEIINDSIKFKTIHSLLWHMFDNYFLAKDMDNKRAIFLTINNGNINHCILPYYLLIDKTGQEKKIVFIASYVPLKVNGKIIAVLEVLTEYTKEWKDIQQLTKEVLLSFLGIFLLFSIIIIHNTKIAQKIIDQQSEVNRKLQEAKLHAEIESSAKTEFLANVSHELRTPLNAIIGFSEMMISENYARINTQQYKEYIQDINNSGKHLLSVINDILDFSKASIEQLKIEKLEINLNKTLISSMRFIKPRADIANIKLITDLPNEQIIIKADSKRLKQALLNLLSNSVKFTAEQGSIILQLRNNKGNKTVEIKVIDTGIGMSEQDIPKALSSFGQVDNKLNRKYDGTGLGLPLTKKLIELMGGEFKLESKLGVGTTATIIFYYED